MEQHQSYANKEQKGSFNIGSVTSPLSAAKLAAKVNSLATSPLTPQKTPIRVNAAVPQKVNVDYKSMVDKLA